MSTTEQQTLLALTPRTRMSQNRGTLWIASAVTIIFFTSGVIFGFDRFKSMLQSKGVYSWECRPGEKLPCEAQTEKMNIMFAVASMLLNMSTFVVGTYLDYTGPRVCSLTGSVFFAVGLILLANSTEHFDAYIPGYTLLGLGGMTMFLSYVDVINIFPEYMGRINGMIVGAFDSSSLIPQLWEIMSRIPRFELPLLFYSYLIIPTLNVFVALTFLGKNQVQSPQSKPQQDDNDDEDDVTITVTRAPRCYNLCDREASEQFTSMEFWLAAYFTGIGMLQLNFYIQTLNEQLAHAYEPEDHAKLGQAFGYILPLGGIVSIPIIGIVLDYGGLIFSFFWLEFLFLLYTGLSMIHIPELQYLTFIVFVVCRTSLYASVTDFTGRMFGFSNFGKVYGAQMSISALFLLLQTPLNKLVSTRLDFNFPLVSGAFMICQLVAIALPCFIYYKNKTLSKNHLDDFAQRPHCVRRRSQNSLTGMSSTGVSVK